MFAIYVTFIVNMDLGKYILASDILIGNFISFMNNFIHWVSYEKHLINPQSHWSPCNAFSFSQAGMLGHYRPVSSKSKKSSHSLIDHGGRHIDKPLV